MRLIRYNCCFEVAFRVIEHFWHLVNSSGDFSLNGTAALPTPDLVLRPFKDNSIRLLCRNGIQTISIHCAVCIELLKSTFAFKRFELRVALNSVSFLFICATISRLTSMTSMNLVNAKDFVRN